MLSPEPTTAAGLPCWTQSETGLGVASIQGLGQVASWPQLVSTDNRVPESVGSGSPVDLLLRECRKGLREETSELHLLLSSTFQFREDSHTASHLIIAETLWKAGQVLLTPFYKWGSEAQKGQ